MQHTPKTNRRDFIKTSSLAAGGVLTSGLLPTSRIWSQAPKKPNFVILYTDQLSLDAIAAHGNPHVSTPNMDRLIQQGVTFMESHSPNPVCSPARSCIFTGRMASETGVISNARAINPNIPTMGKWFEQQGYDTAYCGKWHLPEGFPTKLEGFRVLPAGNAEGDLVDQVVSHNCEAYIRNRKHENPYLLVTSLLQPHDICYWAIKGKALVPETLRFSGIAGELPPLPPNHRIRPLAPAILNDCIYEAFNDLQWQYYRYIYFRMVEMVDREIGRVLDAIEDSGEAENTFIILTSDHGEGAGRHLHVQKWFPYEEAVKVPLVISCPGTIRENHRDSDHLVSGIDIFPTMCELAGIPIPEKTTGRSMAPILLENSSSWREFVVVETHICGRTIRTRDFKYVNYKNDPVLQLFNMKEDPWETNNLYQDPKYSDVLKDHQSLLDEWEKHLNVVDVSPATAPDGSWLERMLDAQYGKKG